MPTNLLAAEAPDVEYAEREKEREREVKRGRDTSRGSSKEM